MISGYTQNHREVEAVGLYLGMLRSWLSLDQFCLGSVVRSCLRFVRCRVRKAAALSGCEIGLRVAVVFLTCNMESRLMVCV